MVTIQRLVIGLKDVIYQVLVIDNGILVNSPIITNNNGRVNHQQ